MQAYVADTEYYLPDGILTNEDLAAVYPDWTAAKIEEKTGIATRHIAAQDECASDLAYCACRKLFDRGKVKPAEIDYLLLCTQSPDYFLPTTACILQDRLGIPVQSGALDFNLGCSGFVYGLSLAKGLLESKLARNVLLVTSETYSKHIHPGDKSVRTLFGDGAAATLITGTEEPTGGAPLLGPFTIGTDGKGWKNLIVPAGGFRRRGIADGAEVTTDDQGNTRGPMNLYMNGPEIFAFTLKSVPRAVADLLRLSDSTIEDIDLFVFHQANRYMLEHLRKKIGIPEHKFCFALREFGNTVSSTIPIALREAQKEGRLHRGMRVMLVGFGVGYSWAGALIRWMGE